MVVVVVSMLCSTLSVTQNPIRVIEISNSLISAGFIGPSSDSDLRIPSRPPGTCATSAGIIRVITKYNATHIRMANGPAAISQSSQVMVLPNAFSIKPIATMFCAAAVLIPTFQMLAVCTVVIISMPGKSAPG